MTVKEFLIEADKTSEVYRDLTEYIEIFKIHQPNMVDDLLSKDCREVLGLTMGDRNKYKAKIQAMLFEDLNTTGDCSINGMLAIKDISEQYQGKVEQNTIDSVLDTARWIQTYFTHCRHGARPIDTVLVSRLIDRLA